MAERNKLASIPGQPLPERQGNFLSDLWDEAKGAVARYGRRSGAQRDASLALMSQAADPNTDPLTGAGMKALGLAGLVTHPLAFFPTREEWDERLTTAGNDSRMSRSIGGFLSDLPSLIDPQMAAGGAVLATAPLAVKMLNQTDDAGDVLRAYHGTDRAFDQFDPSKTRDGAFHFNSSPDVATRYAVSRAMDNGKGANVRPVDLIMKNPKKVDIASRQEIEAAKAEGYDGVIGKDGHYVVFDNSQIRSPFDSAQKGGT